MASRNEKSQINQEPKDPSTKFVVTSRQSTAIIASTLIGSGVLIMPRPASEVAHQSAWLVTLCAAIVAFLIMWTVTKLGLRFPGKTFVEYTGGLLGIKRSDTIGKYVALPILLYFILLWFGLMVMGLRMFGEAIVAAVLPETPLEIIIIVLLLTTFFYMIVELEVVARFNELLLPLLLIPIGFISILSFQNIHWVNVFPMFRLDLSSFLLGIVNQLFGFEGFSIMLLFMAYTQRENNVRASFGGIAIPGITYIFIVFSSVAVFGYEELQHLTWPTLELVKATDFSAFIFQRIESGFVAVWVAAVFTTVGNLFYGVCFSIAQILPTTKEDTARKWIALCLLPIAFWLAMVPESVYQLFKWMHYLGYAGLVAFALPVLLFLLAVIRKQGKGTSRHHEKQRQKKQSSS